MKSIRNNVTLTGQKNLTARQRASHFKSKDHAASCCQQFSSAHRQALHQSTPEECARSGQRDCLDVTRIFLVT